MRRKTLAAVLPFALGLSAAADANPRGGQPAALTIDRTPDVSRLKPRPPATTPPAAPPGTILEGTEIPVDLVVNGERRGEVILRIGAGGSLLVEQRDLAERQLRHAGADEVRIDGIAYVDVRTIPGTQASFDERTLVLRVDLPPEAFERRVIDLTAAANPNAQRTQDTSAFLNYRLEALQAGDADPGLVLTKELGVRYGNWLLRNESSIGRFDGRRRFDRYGSQAIYDDRDRARRWIVGDSIASSGDLGGVFPIAGLALVKAYQLNPYLIQRPLAGYTGTVTTPSEVEVFVGNTPVLRQRLDPGPFDLRNFAYHGGQRDVRVVVRDAYGREQAIEFPFYFTERSLAAGLHDYGYFAGAVRDPTFEGRDRYGRFGASGFHRYGLTDGLTLGARFESSGPFANAGLEAIARLDRFGLLALSGSGSRDRNTRARAGATSLGYLFQRDPWNVRIAARRFDDDYVSVDALGGRVLPRRDESAGIGFSSETSGSIDLSGTRHVGRGGERRRSMSLSYSRVFFRSLNFIATWRRQGGDVFDGDEYFLGLFYNPAPDMSVSLVHTKAGAQSTEALQVSRTVDPGLGLGYRLSLERSHGATATQSRVSPQLQYNTSWATFLADAREVVEGDGASSRRLAMQGALTWVGGYMAATRPVYDSFAQVQVVPALEGIRIYQNNREIGRTPASGRLLVPNLGSFHDNTLAIEPKDIPIEYAIDAVSRVVSPPFRSGSLVTFPVARVQAVSARLLQRVGGKLEPLTYHEGRMRIGAHDRAFPIGGDGGFYLDEVPAGRYAGTVSTAAGTCRFTLDVPASAEPVVELKEPLACEAVP